MTRLSSVTLNCNCGNSLNVVYEASINLWLSRHLIRNFLNGKLYKYSCKNCGKLIRLVTEVLINTPSEMFWISTGEEPESLRKILKKHGVIDDDEGKVIDPLEQKLLRWSQERKQPTSEE